MTDRNRELAGICGIYCGSCPFYLAPRAGDREQVMKLAGQRGVDPEEVFCDGCLSDRVFKDCRECGHGFRACAREKGVTWCFECGEFPCDRLEKFLHIHVVNGVSHHEHVVEELAEMREKGVGAWLGHLEKRVKCPECGRRQYWFNRHCPGCGSKVGPLDRP